MMMKKYVLDIRCGKDTNIDIDKAENVTTEEFEKVLDGLRNIMNTFLPKFKFRPIDELYMKEFEDGMTKALNNIGKVIYVERMEEFRICFAFMA